MSVLDDFRASFDARVAGPARPVRTRPPVLTMLARLLGTFAGLVLGFARRARSDVLTVASLGCGVAGAFQFGLAAGLFGLMAAGLILEWAMRTE